MPLLAVTRLNSLGISFVPYSTEVHVPFEGDTWPLGAFTLTIAITSHHIIIFITIHLVVIAGPLAGFDTIVKLPGKSLVTTAI